jgi:hypothetical protein
MADTTTPTSSPDNTGKRLDRIESALAAALGINLDHHDDQQTVAARRQRLAEAAAKAASLVKEAFVEDELTVEQRIQKIEEILNSRGALI